MKIKVKGLVFVGFAAAILSASAMADPSGTTITSLAYTEDTYQKLSNIQTSFTDANEDSTTLYPSMGAVSAKITSAVGSVPSYSDFTGTDGTQAGAHGLVPAPATTDANKVLGSSGSWVGAFGAATAQAAGTTGLVPAPGIGDQAKVLNGSGDWVDLPTVNNATLTVQLNSTEVGTFSANASSAATINIDGVEETDNKLDGSTNNTIADYSNNTTKYTSAKAVYDFVTNQPSAGIPAKSTTNCTAEHPCALVAETSGFHWRVMAISANQSPAAGTCGDATGNCGDSVTPSSGD